jgi:hypothetical protein
MVVEIGIIHHILYFYFNTFVTGRLKSNLLSPLKLLVLDGTNFFIVWSTCNLKRGGGSKCLCKIQ